ncbi:MAG TPA: kelch repeat-containing protein [Thermoplasmata archaeon]|nr:kelch repeat-containing protein [Thermoplasmata archaeon]
MDHSAPILSGGVLLQEAERILGGGTPLTLPANISSSGWTQLFPAAAPRPRAQEAIAYDPTDGYVVIYGGFDSHQILNDTWTFSGGVWTNLTATAGSPGARRSAMMSWDSVDGYAVLFGGSNAQGNYLNDTWKFVGGHWHRMTTPVAPVGRRSFGMAYDAADGYVVLFGGHTKRGVGGAYGFLNDTWTFTGGRWTEVYAADSPSVRAEPNMAWDGGDSYVLLFGGYSNDHAPALRDTWSFAAGVWTNRTTTGGPGGRDGAGIDYNATGGYVLMFGGHSRGKQYNDTWVYYAGAWSQLRPSTPPGGRSGDRLSWDAKDGYMVLFAGSQFPKSWLNDTWSFD